MRKLILLFITICATGSFAQNLSVTVTQPEDINPGKIHIYIDKSYSVQGFLNASQTRENDIGRLFQNIESGIRDINSQKNSKIFSLDYYVFATECEDTSLGTKFIDVRTKVGFTGADNVYSAAITSLKKSLNTNDVGILITDGVPSLASNTNISASNINRLQQEYGAIGNAISDFLSLSGENTVSIFRYVAAYDGWYYFSDSSEKRKWTGNRNLYALVFAKKQHLKLINDLLNNKDIKDRFKVLKLSSQLNDNINNKAIIKASPVKNKNKRAVFDISIPFHEPLAPGTILGIVDSTGVDSDSVVLISDRKIVYTEPVEDALKINFSIPLEKLVKEGETRYTIVAENGIEKARIAFDDLNIESEGKESDVFTDDASFHDRTFRLYYLTDAIVNTQKPQRERLIDNPRYGFEIPFSIQYENSWKTLVEPMFGLIPPPATLSEINDFLVPIPLQLLLFRWLTPIALACLIFFLFLNHNGMRFTNPQQQKIIWWSGFALTLIIVTVAACIMVFREYSGETLALGYKIKHLLYNPLFSLLIYVGLSLILTRGKNCTACNNPLPF